jgi:single-strand DNA-binding protein
MVNKVILVGNLVRDAESIAAPRGPVTRMRLATTLYWRDAEGNHRESSEYHNLVAFQRLAEICGQYCLKGRRIYAEGRLRTRDYDGPDGVRRTATDVVLEHMRLLDRREDTATDPQAAGVEALTGGAAPPDEHGLDDAGTTPTAVDESQLALSGAAR